LGYSFAANLIVCRKRVNASLHAVCIRPNVLFASVFTITTNDSVMDGKRGLASGGFF